MTLSKQFAIFGPSRKRATDSATPTPRTERGCPMTTSRKRRNAKHARNPFDGKLKRVTCSTCGEWFEVLMGFWLSKTPSQCDGCKARSDASALNNGKAAVALLPRHGIVVLGVASPRFIRLFRKTWGMLPLSVRRAILRLWRRPGKEPDLTIRVTAKQPSPSSVARVTKFGRVVEFWALSVARRSDASACLLIAHELAHVYSLAIRLNVCEVTGLSGFTHMSENEAETEADAFSEAWMKGDGK